MRQIDSAIFLLAVIMPVVNSAATHRDRFYDIQARLEDCIGTYVLTGCNGGMGWDRGILPQSKELLYLTFLSIQGGSLRIAV